MAAGPGTVLVPSIPQTLRERRGWGSRDTRLGDCGGEAGRRWGGGRGGGEAPGRRSGRRCRCPDEHTTCTKTGLWVPPIYSQSAPSTATNAMDFRARQPLPTLTVLKSMLTLNAAAPFCRSPPRGHQFDKCPWGPPHTLTCPFFAILDDLHSGGATITERSPIVCHTFASVDG